MNCEPLKKHIIDTVKEWQMKIGYRAESMKLYYPAASLAELLEPKKRKVLWETLLFQKRTAAGI